MVHICSYDTVSLGSGVVLTVDPAKGAILFVGVASLQLEWKCWACGRTHVRLCSHFEPFTKKKRGQLFFTELLLIGAGDHIVFWHSGHLGVAAGEPLVWGLALQQEHGYMGHLCAFSQAAETMCSSLQPELSLWLNIRIFFKLGNLSSFFVLSVFSSHLQVDTEFTLFALRTHSAPNWIL